MKIVASWLLRISQNCIFSCTCTSLLHSHCISNDMHSRCISNGMGRLRLVGSWKLQLSFAKEPYKRDYFLQKRPTILRSLVCWPLFAHSCFFFGLFKFFFLPSSPPHTHTPRRSWKIVRWIWLKKKSTLRFYLRMQMVIAYLCAAFWVYIGLFWVYTGLFWVYMGLFWIYVGLFYICGCGWWLLTCVGLFECI